MKTALRIRLQRLGLSNKRFAEISGVSLSTVIRATNGKSISPLATRAIAEAFERIAKQQEDPDRDH